MSSTPLRPAISSAAIPPLDLSLTRSPPNGKSTTPPPSTKKASAAAQRLLGNDKFDFPATATAAASSRPSINASSASAASAKHSPSLPASTPPSPPTPPESAETPAKKGHRKSASVVTPRTVERLLRKKSSLSDSALSHGKLLAEHEIEKLRKMWGLENISYWSARDIKKIIPFPPEMQKEFEEVNQKKSNAFWHRIFFFTVLISKIAFKHFDPLKKYKTDENPYIVDLADFTNQFMDEILTLSGYFLTEANANSLVNIGAEREALCHKLHKEYENLGLSLLRRYRIFKISEENEANGDDEKGAKRAEQPGQKGVQVQESVIDKAKAINKHWQNVIKTLQAKPLSLSSEAAERTAYPLKNAAEIIIANGEVDGLPETSMTKSYEDMVDKENSEKAKKDKVKREREAKAAADKAKADESTAQEERNRKLVDELQALSSQLSKLKIDLERMEAVDIVKKLETINAQIAEFQKEVGAKKQAEDAFEAITGQARQIRQEIDSLKESQSGALVEKAGELSRQIEGLESAKTEIVRTAASQADSMASLDKRITDVLKQMDTKLSEQSTAQSSKNTEITDLIKNLENQKDAIRKLAESSAESSVEAYKRAEAQILELTAQLKALGLKQDETVASHERHKTYSKKLGAALKAHTTQLKDTKEANDQTNKKINHWMDVLAGLEKEMTTAKKSHTELKAQLESLLSTVKESCEQNQKLDTKYDSVIAGLKEELEALKKKVTDAPEQQKAAISKEITPIKDKIVELEACKTELQKEIAVQLREIARLSAKVTSLDENVKAVSTENKRQDKSLRILNVLATRVAETSMQIYKIVEHNEEQISQEHDRVDRLDLTVKSLKNQQSRSRSRTKSPVVYKQPYQSPYSQKALAANSAAQKANKARSKMSAATAAATSK